MHFTPHNCIGTSTGSHLSQLVVSYYTQTEYKDVQSSTRAIDQTAVCPLLTALTLLQCADPHPARNEGMGARQRSVCLFQAVTDARSTNSATTLTGCKRAVRCSNCQSFELCFETNVLY